MPISGLTFAQKKESEVLSYLQTELASGRFLASEGLGFVGHQDAGFTVTRGVGSAASVERDRVFNLMTRGDTSKVPLTVSVYFQQTPAELATAFSTEASAGRELSVIHVEGNRRGEPSFDLIFYGFQAEGIVRNFAIPIVAAGIESTSAQDTGYTIPENSMLIASPRLKIITPEATGATKTIDLGYAADNTAFEGNVDCSSALDWYEMGTTNGIPQRVADHDAGDQNITFKFDSADWVEFVGVLFVDLLVFE